MRSGQTLHGTESWSHERHGDQLGNPITRIDDKGFVRIQVDQRDTNLAPIRGIDGARRVHNRNSVLGSKSATRNDKGDEAIGQGDGEPCSDRGPSPRSKRDVLGR